jgi:hypothetical protein
MKQNRRLRGVSTLVACMGLLAVLGASPVADAQEDSDLAIAAAEQEATRWLEALDAGRHAESWDNAAAVMKEGRSLADWVRDVAAPRETFGKSVMRELERKEFSTSVRGGPSGKYVTLKYLTQFTKAPPVYETILLVLEQDHWRIAGYSLERAPEPAAPAPAAAEPAPADAKSAAPAAPKRKK